MALKNPYCTVEQVQRELRNSDESLVPEIEEAINAASRFVDATLGYDFAQHDHTTDPLLLYWTSRYIAGCQLWIPYPNIQSLTRVSVAGVDFMPGVDYVATSRRLARIDGRDWLPEGAAYAVEIYGLFGFPQTSETDVPAGMPEHIVRATILLAAAFSGHNQKEFVSADGSVMHITDKAISKTVWDILQPHRVIRQ